LTAFPQGRLSCVQIFAPGFYFDDQTQHSHARKKPFATGRIEWDETSIGHKGLRQELSPKNDDEEW